MQSNVNRVIEHENQRQVKETMNKLQWVKMFAGVHASPDHGTYNLYITFDILQKIHNLLKLLLEHLTELLEISTGEKWFRSSCFQI